MNINKQSITTLRLAAALAGLLVSGILAEVAQAAIDFHQAGAAGGGQQFVYAPSTPISGTTTPPPPSSKPILNSPDQLPAPGSPSATRAVFRRSICLGRRMWEVSRWAILR